MNLALAAFGVVSLASFQRCVLENLAEEVHREYILMVTDNSFRQYQLNFLFISHGQVLALDEIQTFFNSRHRVTSLFFIDGHPLEVESTFLHLQLVKAKLGLNQAESCLHF